MNTRELEELIVTIRQFLQKARSRDDAFEYCRLCDELRLAEAALAATDCEHSPHQAANSSSNTPLAMA